MMLAHFSGVRPDPQPRPEWANAAVSMAVRGRAMSRDACPMCGTMLPPGADECSECGETEEAAK